MPELGRNIICIYDGFSNTDSDSRQSVLEKFIQKSVGNNLNDLYKIDKNLALKIINSWKKEIETGNMTDSEIKGVNWIIKHGLRSNKIGK